MLKSNSDKNLVHNFVVNLFDGGFFGFALGFASFVTVIPLFVSTMTNSALLIGLIPAIHNVGWQLPQLLTANRVARLRRVKPMVLLITINERFPFLGLAAIAWFAPYLHVKLALVLTFLLLIWQGLGGGFTATAWQSMIVKIIPSELRGTFLGAQGSAANLLASGSAIIAGFILEKVDSPLDFTLCFLFATGAMVFSWGSLAMTREQDSPNSASLSENSSLIQELGILARQSLAILRKDNNFVWFLICRMTTQVGAMAFAFYVVYAVRFYGMSESTAGVMTSVLLVTGIIANPVLGWIGDRFDHRLVMAGGALFAALSAAIAWMAPSVGWFYLVVILTGIANTTMWTVTMTMNMHFGSDAERPTYIGMANTLIAPATILAPLAGGWLADNAGYSATFATSVIGGLVTALLLVLKLRDPRNQNYEPSS